MLQHSIDPLSCYCTRCGQAMQLIVEREQECIPEDPRVIAISHRVRGLRLLKLTREVTQLLCSSTDP